MGIHGGFCVRMLRISLGVRAARLRPSVVYGKVDNGVTGNRKKKNKKPALWSSKTVTEDQENTQNLVGVSQNPPPCNLPAS